MEEKVPKDAQVSSKSNGKTPSAEKTEIIRHFTSVECLCLILKNGFRMSDAQNWEDKNDSYGIRRYAELQNGQKVLVLCFCTTKGNVYHWKSLKSQKGLMCSIDIKKDEFFNYVRTLDGFREPKYVDYCNNDEIPKKDKENMPYLKRSEYRIENEIRILYVGDRTDVLIPNIQRFIASITIDSSNPELYKLAEDTLVNQYGIGKKQIKKNGFTDSKVWQQNIDKIIANSK